MNIKVAVNGYGVIGKRVADAVRAMPDMDLVGVADIATDWHEVRDCFRTRDPHG